MNGDARRTAARLQAAVASVFLLATIAAATGADAQTTRIPTVTRLVALYHDRESAFGNAIRAGDKPEIERTLADDFELRVGARPAQPIPRDGFVQSVLRTRDAGGEISGMAVHDLGDTAIASFTQGGGIGAIFVVDVWRKQGSDWKLAIRYANRAGGPQGKIPGADASPPDTIPKKY